MQSFDKKGFIKWQYSDITGIHLLARLHTEKVIDLNVTR